MKDPLALYPKLEQVGPVPIRGQIVFISININGKEWTNAEIAALNKKQEEWSKQ
jgi:hypothetical protein